MSFNESESYEKTQELSELYQQNAKAQPKTEQSKQTKQALTKSSTSEQLEGAIAETQQKVVEGGKLASKAAIAAGKKRGSELYQQVKKGKDLAFLDAWAEDEIKTAHQLIEGIPSFNSVIDQANADDIESLIDLDEDEELAQLKKEVEGKLKHSKNSLTTNNLLFGG